MIHEGASWERRKRNLPVQKDMKKTEKKKKVDNTVASGGPFVL